MLPRAYVFRFRKASLFLGLLLNVARLTGAPQFADESQLVNHVIDLIDRRLALMPEVAAIKYREGKPITDAARERDVIEQSAAEARAIQLEPDAARTFFALQIQLARTVQENCFARWRNGSGGPIPARDLVREIRPALDALGRELLVAVYVASPSLVALPPTELSARLTRLRQHEGVSEDLLAELARALSLMRLTAPPNWAVVRRTGVLRVGTTGDYAPFSELRGSDLNGLDIELAQSLAGSWGVSILFVHTTWPTLMRDLASNRFDLAASGITITAERQQVATFSVPYCFDGKTAIARRVDAGRFASLEAIDQPGVRVIVNPGGTNERYARERIRRATLIVHADNRTIFDEIIAGRADVMITDGIEVRLQERRHPELKGTMAAPLTRTGKAILLPRSSDLASHVDAWLQPEVAAGSVDARLSRQLGAVGN